MSDEDNAGKYSVSVPVDEKSALVIFNGSGVDRFVGDIEDEVRGFVFDVSSAKGRKEIASMAHKVSRSKTALDSLGKNLVSDWKKKAKAVDQERKMLRDRLDALRDEVRRPLTDWEEAEAKKAEEEATKKEIAQAFEFAVIENDLFDKNREIQRREEAVEKERVEAARKKAAEEEEKRRLKEEARIKREAEEAARLDAERRIKEEKERAEREVIAAKVAEEQAKERAKKDAELAEARRLKELKDQKEMIEREAREKAEREEKEAARIKAAEEKKAANKKHQAAVNNGILKELLAIGISEEHGKELITRAAKCLVKNLVITY